MINVHGEESILNLRHPSTNAEVRVWRKLDFDSGEELFYQEKTTLEDGTTAITDADLGYWYIKIGGKYFRRMKSVKDLAAEEKKGISTQSVSAVLSVVVAHGLGKIPTNVILTHMSLTAKGWDSVTVDATNITVTYGAAITGSWKMGWLVS